MSPKTRKLAHIFALLVRSPRSKFVFLMGFWLNAWNEVFGYHMLKIFTSFAPRNWIKKHLSDKKMAPAYKLNETAEVVLGY